MNLFFEQISQTSIGVKTYVDNDTHVKHAM